MEVPEFIVFGTSHEVENTEVRDPAHLHDSADDAAPSSQWHSAEAKEGLGKHW